MTETKTPTKRVQLLRILVTIGFWMLLAGAILGGVAYVSPTAREVLYDAFFYGIAFFGTPFVLELTVAVIGVLVVLTVSHWRIQQEGDGWVYLAVPDAGAEGDPDHRLDPVVLQEGPGAIDDLDSRLATIEGFLDLGLSKEATEALDSLSKEEQGSDEAVALRSRVEKES